MQKLICFEIQMFLFAIDSGRDNQSLECDCPQNCEITLYESVTDKLNLNDLSASVDPF